MRYVKLNHDDPKQKEIDKEQKEICKNQCDDDCSTLSIYIS